ncbi:MAG: DUF6054 family protein [Propionicimonas sp.]
MQTMTVSLTPSQAAQLVRQQVEASGASVECVGEYVNRAPDGREVILLVFEKYFMRNSSRASLSVVLESLNGQTWAGYLGSGGGQGAVFGFDWGTAEDFASAVTAALEPYVLR